MDIDDTNGPFATIPVELNVSLGRSRTRISELLSLRPETVLRLDRAIDDPVELFVGDKLIAYGELTEVEEDGVQRLAVRVIKVCESDAQA